jgi:hypothetical protein
MIQFDGIVLSSDAGAAIFGLTPGAVPSPLIHARLLARLRPGRPFLDFTGTGSLNPDRAYSRPAGSVRLA